MNRIILIGNGFDLAHGLKTSYNDFIEWILETKFNKIKESNFSYRDYDIEYHNNNLFIQGSTFIQFKTNFIYKKNEVILKSVLGERIDNYPNVAYHNNFLFSMIENKYFRNWCDIETLFYDELNELLDNKHTTDEEIEKFNSDFQRIIDLLAEYLLVVLENKGVIDKSIQLRILELLNSNVKQNQLSIEYKNNNKPLTYTTNNRGEEIYTIGEKDVDKCIIIDFNYTQTIYPYLIDNKTQKLKDKFIYINIHGELKQNNNPIIFGFGDELDDNYKKIEKSRLNGVLKYIKSINYLKTSNYREVLNFLELKDFQVFSWGHSCGLTDRTLLNHIFEHKNCAGIMPYYYQRFNEETKEYSNNYIEIVSNIARNFTDKNKLRDRVVNFQFCEPLIK